MPKLPSLSLETLDGLAGLFADAYPASAGVLATPSQDPDIERLRQALLMLSGSVFDRATDFGNEGYETLGALLCPSILRPTPAATVLELTSNERTIVRRGAEAMTAANHRFTCANDCHVAPIRIEKARVRTVGGREVLEFEVVSTADAPLAAALGDSLEVFVHDHLDAALRVCSMLARASVTAFVDDQSGAIPLSVSLPGATPLCPEPDGPPQAVLLLRDYFQIPLRFATFRLSGLSAVAALPKARRLRVRAEVSSSQGKIELARDALHPNCVVAINLFETTADPSSLDPVHTSSVLRISELGPSARLFDVIDVSVADRDRGGPSVVIPAMRRLGVQAVDPRAPYAYSVEVDDATATPRLTFVSPLRARPVPTQFVVSARVLATNGAAAAQLSPGAIHRAGVGMRTSVQNILPTSWCADRPVGSERTLRVDAFAQLAGAFSARESLRNLLLAILPSRGLPAATSRAHRRRIDAIESVNVDTDVRWQDGMAASGYRVRIGIDESAFDGRGDVELFARVLREVIARSSPLEAPVRLEAHLRIADEAYVVE